MESRRSRNPKQTKSNAPRRRFNKSVKKNTRINSTREIGEKAPNVSEMRLNRYISNSGVCSRRDADVLIQKGLIEVNGKVITEMGYKVKASDEVLYKGKLLSRERLVYLLLNKPKGFISTTDDPEERKTVMNLVENACTERIYPVGRLDKNTTGLLLFTNDGKLSKELTHPSHEVKKIYQVELSHAISQEDIEKISEGLELEDGMAKVDNLMALDKNRKKLGIELHIGRNRIVRRIFEHLGYEVTKLDRVFFAGLTKKNLPRGKWRFLHPKEVIWIKHMR